MDAERIVVYCLVIWFARNKFIFERKKIDPRVSATKSESVLEACQGMRKSGTAHLSNARRGKQQIWKPTP